MNEPAALVRSTIWPSIMSGNNDLHVAHILTSDHHRPSQREVISAANRCWDFHRQFGGLPTSTGQSLLVGSKSAVPTKPTSTVASASASNTVFPAEGALKRLCEPACLFLPLPPR